MKKLPMRTSIYMFLMVCRCLAGVPESRPAEQAAQITTHPGMKSDAVGFERGLREQLSAAEIEWENIKFSGYPTDELVNMALTFEPSSPAASARVDEELRKRPQELRIALLKVLDRSVIPFDVLYRIPFVAGKVDAEFQVEIAKRCLFRNEMKEADLALRIREEHGKGIFSLIAKSKNDETAILDKLISEGRLTEDSEFYREWKIRLSNQDETRQSKGAGSLLHSESNGKLSVPPANRTKEEIFNVSWLVCALLVVIAIGTWRLIAGRLHR